MQVLVDTSVWSLVLRRNPSTAGLVSSATGSDAAPGSAEHSAEHSAAAVAARLVALAAATALRDLVADGRAAMLGVIRQELLCGIKSTRQFVQLRNALQGFVDISLRSTDHELAAEFFNTCRSCGVQGSNTDFLICAVASARQMPILSTDQDFDLYQQHLPIQLWKPQMPNNPSFL